MNRCACSLTFLAFAAGLCGCSDGVKWLDDGDRRAPLVARAIGLRDSGDLSGAAKALARAAQNNPGLARVHLDYAILLHDEQRDYVRAIYHYRRYLELRPSAEKEQMVKSRLRLAEYAFAASIIQPDRVGEEKVRLENENAQLKAKIEELKAEIARIESATRQAVASATPSAARGTPAVSDGPAAAAVKTAGRSALVRGPTRAEAPSEKSGEPTGPAVVRTYRVKRGDTLGRIASEVYGDPARWQDIHEANREVLGPNPERLKQGQILTIP